MFSQPSRPRRSSLESGWGSTPGFLVVMGQISITRTSSLYIYWLHDSKFLGLQPISILVLKIWLHVPHPSNGQNMSKTTPFRRQKRRFLERFWFQEIWWRRFKRFDSRLAAVGTKLKRFYVSISLLIKRARPCARVARVRPSEPPRRAPDVAIHSPQKPRRPRPQFF